MDSTVKIPNGEEKITVELTVKEAIALASGTRFNDQRNVLLGARKKLQTTLKQKQVH